ncbi:hypothetical protein EXN66_Car012443 [Channa argus]|uniref:Uncharacterized protein n=1 Tax=Channa argus TaxID=215402 RepID=A0A6G1Q2L0_CHAAH|nr:hypothetical protein EXN66_Car012443 [Channa argus]
MNGFYDSISWVNRDESRLRGRNRLRTYQDHQKHSAFFTVNAQMFQELQSLSV